MWKSNFSSSHIKKKASKINNITYVTQNTQKIIISTRNQIQKILMRYLTLSNTKSSNLLCFLHLQCISIQNSHISRDQEPQVARSSSVGQ